MSPREALVLQVVAATELKAGGVIGPYRSRSYAEGEAAPASPRGSSSAAAQADKAAASSSSQSSSSPSSSSSSSALNGAPAGLHVTSGGRSTLVVALLHSGAAQVLPLLQQVWTIAQAVAVSVPGYERLAIETGILAPRRDGAFNLALLGDYREKPLLPVEPALAASRVFPLVSCPGRLMLTERALYIQPIAINNVAGSDPVCAVPVRAAADQVVGISGRSLSAMI